jgi:DNA ligase (NAD+)
MSEKLAEEYKTLDAVLAAKEGDLLKLEKVGEKLAAAVVSGLKSRAALIADLLKEVKIKVSKPASGPLAGKSFCLTGHVEFDHDGKHYDSRPDIEDMIKAKGGSIKSVSKGLDFLVAGDEAGSKLEKAGKLGVAVIDGKALAAKL